MTPSGHEAASTLDDVFSGDEVRPIWVADLSAWRCVSVRPGQLLQALLKADFEAADAGWQKWVASP